MGPMIPSVRQQQMIQPSPFQPQQLSLYDPKYHADIIIGPISYSVYKVRGKTIYMFGDLHTPSESCFFEN